MIDGVSGNENPHTVDEQLYIPGYLKACQFALQVVEKLAG